MRSKILFSSTNGCKFTVSAIAKYMFSVDTPSKHETYHDNGVVIYPKSKALAKNAFENMIAPYHDYFYDRLELTTVELMGEIARTLNCVCKGSEFEDGIYRYNDHLTKYLELTLRYFSYSKEVCQIEPPQKNTEYLDLNPDDLSQQEGSRHAKA